MLGCLAALLDGLASALTNVSGRLAGLLHGLTSALSGFLESLACAYTAAGG